MANMDKSVAVIGNSKGVTGWSVKTISDKKRKEAYTDSYYAAEE